MVSYFSLFVSVDHTEGNTLLHLAACSEEEYVAVSALIFFIRHGMTKDTIKKQNRWWETAESYARSIRLSLFHLFVP